VALPIGFAKRKDFDSVVAQQVSARKSPEKIYRVWSAPVAEDYDDEQYPKAEEPNNFARRSSFPFTLTAFTYRDTSCESR